MQLKLIVSGGQRGSDIGGLDAAIAMGIPHDGFCPKGRRCESGKIPDIYNLRETASSGYEERTELNVEFSDATIIFVKAELTKGSSLTKSLCKDYEKPHRVIQTTLFDGPISSEKTIASIVSWLRDFKVEVLNVAGSRESTTPGIEALVKAVMVAVIERLKTDAPTGESQEAQGRLFGP